jgi:DNA-directed RNA polymerase subunit M/transcription elongation factor TFIIS
MDDNEPVTVDFVFSEEFDAQAQHGPEAGIELNTCICGTNQYVIANEMLQDRLEGLPASRMYECMGCGRYSLG